MNRRNSSRLPDEAQQEQLSRSEERRMRAEPSDEPSRCLSVLCGGVCVVGASAHRAFIRRQFRGQPVRVRMTQPFRNAEHNVITQCHRNAQKKTVSRKISQNAE